MFEIKVSTQFCAAHFLKHYKGKCESLHGHNWKVDVTVASTRLNRLGMIMDFKDLKALLNQVTVQLDHSLLNEIRFFKSSNTTSEIIAQYIFMSLRKKIKQFCKTHRQRPPALKEVVVWEQENSCAIYRETQRQ